MSESGQTTESPSAPLDSEDRQHRTFAGSQSSKLGGGGVGGLMIWAATYFDLKDPYKTGILTAAPFVAAYISAYAPAWKNNVVWCLGLLRLLVVKSMLGWLWKDAKNDQEGAKRLAEICALIADYLTSSVKRKKK